MRDGEGDAAALRLAFDRAAESFPGSVTRFLESRGPAGFDEVLKLMAWWNQFYEAIRDTTAGLALLAELQAVKDKG